VVPTEEQRKEKGAAKEERHAKILASMDESKLYLAYVDALNEQVKKQNLSVFTLETTLFALKGNNDPDAVAVVNDCVALLTEKARATKLMQMQQVAMQIALQARKTVRRCQLRLVNLACKSTCNETVQLSYILLPSR
jgi:hypothetical protein